jgi:uncharacterized protein HemX
MKKILIIGGLILAVVLILAFFVYATGQDKAKPQQQTEAVQKADKHECANCTATCPQNPNKAECKCSDECKRDCAKCKEACAKGQCTKCKPGECKKE